MTVSASRPGGSRVKGRNRRARVAVLALPYLWSVLAIAGVGRIHGFLAGIPFLLWWMMAGVIVTFGALAVAWRGDERRRGTRDRQLEAGRGGS